MQLAVAATNGLLALLGPLSGSAGAQEPAASLEQQLADRYVPIA